MYTVIQSPQQALLFHSMDKIVHSKFTERWAGLLFCDGTWAITKDFATWTFSLKDSSEIVDAVEKGVHALINKGLVEFILVHNFGIPIRAENSPQDKYRDLASKIIDTVLGELRKSGAFLNLIMLGAVDNTPFELVTVLTAFVVGAMVSTVWRVTSLPGWFRALVRTKMMMQPYEELAESIVAQTLDRPENPLGRIAMSPFRMSASHKDNERFIAPLGDTLFPTPMALMSPMFKPSKKSAKTVQVMGPVVPPLPLVNPQFLPRTGPVVLGAPAFLPPPAFLGPALLPSGPPVVIDESSDSDSDDQPVKRRRRRRSRA
ncbi:hypothetical protein GGF32_005334 [Allomyces javanicus]|nr:hypothetical protein GGF32_005334 [Allomyces javanicus]